MRYRLYLDESGDHSASDPKDIGKRYLGLVGVFFQQAEPYRTFTEELDTFRRDIFGEDPPVLHREDILYRSGDLSSLKDAAIRERFDTGLLTVFKSAKCKIVAVVVDKHTHKQASYRVLTHPYHYCLHAILERYCGFLNLHDHTGDVMAESRGKVEDMALKEEFSRIYRRGTSYISAQIVQKVLTSREIKIKPKHAGVHGLQLADVLAHPLTRDVLFAYQRIPALGGGYCNLIAEIAQEKYNNRLANGKIKGYGKVIL